MNEQTIDMIDITGVDLKLFIKKVYDLSVSQGLGFLHFTPEPLSDKECNEILNYGYASHVVLSVDYLNGRACKMVVFKIDEKLWIRDNWYDHTAEQLEILLKYIKTIKENIEEKDNDNEV